MSATTFDGVRPRTRSVSLPVPELLALLTLAAGLNLWGLSINGMANEYYSGAVRSMWAAPRNRMRGVLAGGAALLVAGLFWPVLVWLVPASSRPWISGTSDNSI